LLSVELRIGEAHDRWRAVSAEQAASPARLRLRVGVTGHRGPPKLPQQSETPPHKLLKLLDRVFTAVTAPQREGHGLVFADGADRMLKQTLQLD
jgi:hypothetical protein